MQGILDVNLKEIQRLLSGVDAKVDSGNTDMSQLFNHAHLPPPRCPVLIPSVQGEGSKNTLWIFRYESTV